MLLLRCLVFTLLWSSVTPNPLELFAGRKRFSVEQVSVPNPLPWNGPASMQRTYLKYGLKVPAVVQEALKNAAAVDPPLPGQASIGAKPIYGDSEYLINVKVGNNSLSLNLDTGSADLWVFSTLQPAHQRANRPSSRIYDPKGSGAKLLQGHSWQIRYEDLSSANGQVYLEKVTLSGDLIVHDQAIGVATSVSRSLTMDTHTDGLMGLGFTTINSIKPTQQKTLFDNMRSNLAAPLFASALKRRAVGSYDFGFIDKKKYTGEITWAPVKSNTGYWDFSCLGYAVGDGEIVNTTIRATADTGTSLWYLPKPIADAYYAKVLGASYSILQAGWVFPCDAKLPDMTVVIGGKRINVPGINMNYQTVSARTCYGGIQRDSSMTSYIFGDVFLKGLYVIHEHPVNKQPRLGFAHQPR